jgi:hypothetical protein
MGDPSARCTSDPMGLMCKHLRDNMGHCSVVTCANHHNECPRHGGTGPRQNQLHAATAFTGTRFYQENLYC